MRTEFGGAEKEGASEETVAAQTSSAVDLKEDLLHALARRSSYKVKYSGKYCGGRYNKGSLTLAQCAAACTGTCKEFFTARQTGSTKGTCYTCKAGNTAYTSASGYVVYTNAAAASKPLKNCGASAHTKGKLAECDGDCDSDGHCATGLKRFQRTGKSAVPGCRSGGSGDVKDYDYCVKQPPHKNSGPAHTARGSSLSAKATAIRTATALPA